MSNGNSGGDNNKKATKSTTVGVALYCAFMGTMAAVGTFPMWQEKAGDWLHEEASDEVRKLAAQAAEKAAAYCGNEKTGYYTYEVINGLYDNRLLYSFRPYNASGLAETLNKMADKDIFVRAAEYRNIGESRTAAAFIKGDGVTPDSLVLGGMAGHAELTATFMEQVIAQADTMKPGAALVLDYAYEQGGFTANIVAVAPDATSYKAPAPSGNPFAEAVRFSVPGPACLRY